MNIPGYEHLAVVLQAAYDQAAKGKGAERHARGNPFHEQHMQTISTLLNSDDGMAFQAIKKLTEGLGFTDHDRRERELLGVIVYVAGIIVWHREHRESDLADDLQALATAGGTAHALFHGPDIQVLTNPSSEDVYSRFADDTDRHLRRTVMLSTPNSPGEDIYAEFAARMGTADRKIGKAAALSAGYTPNPNGVHFAAPIALGEPCPECEYPADAAGTHYATCSKLTAPKEFVEQVEQTFDDLEDAADQRMDNIARNGNDGEHYDDPWLGAPEWAKWKAQDETGAWYWYEFRPEQMDECWTTSIERSRFAGNGKPHVDWRDTLIQRP